MEKKFNSRDFIGFVLFMAIIGDTFYAIQQNTGGIAYLSLIVTSIAILIFWLNPSIEELKLKYNKGSVKVKQKKGK